MQRIDVAGFAAEQLVLLEKEHKAELQETQLLTATHSPATLAARGLALLNLIVSAQRTGFGGKTLLELSLDPAVRGAAQSDLPAHGLKVGDICAVQEQPSGAEKKRERRGKEERGLSGVVVRQQRSTITVALQSGDAQASGGTPTGKLWLVKLANDVVHRRLVHTMRSLQTEPSKLSVLTQVLFGQSSPSPPDVVTDIQWQDATLNESQQEAVRFALASREVALIHGPPGTGKTHTLIEVILQFLRRKCRLLVCGPSNISVDNIVERLAKHRVRMVRVGHPARLLPSVLTHSLEVLSRTSDAASIVADIRSEMDAKQAAVKKTRSGHERRAIYRDLGDLRKEYRAREGRVVDELLRGSDVVLSTLHGAGAAMLRDQRFDVIIIDEASQALEAQCWIPVLANNASRLVLAGDHLQLPPTIKSSNMKRGNGRADTVETSQSDSTKKSLPESTNGEHELEDPHQSNLKSDKLTLATTLFDRLLSLHGNSIKRMLTTQYRMHEKIMRFSSDALYDSKLMAATEVKARLLKDLPYDVSATEDSAEPLVFWDTQGGNFPERDTSDEDMKGRRSMLAESKMNEGEAALVRKHVQSLVDSGVKPEDIAIITPYNGQLALLYIGLEGLFPGVEMGSVDGFQGREKEAVVVSLVRSNPDHEVGFLDEKRRLNVAMTRAKRHLAVIGDSETISSGSSFLKSWMSHLEEHADLRYPDPAEVMEP